MDKARQAMIRMEMIDGKCEGEISGKCCDVGNMMLTVFMDAAEDDRDIRCMLRKTARIFLRESSIFRGVTDYVRGRVLTGILGAAAIYGALYGVGAVLHWIGVV